MSPLVGGKVSRSCSTAPAGAWPPGGGMGAACPAAAARLTFGMCQQVLTGFAARISDFGSIWTFHSEQGAFPNQCQVSTEPRLGVPQTPFRFR